MSKLTETIKLRVSANTYRQTIAAATKAKRNLSDFVRIVLEAAIGKDKS